MSILGRLAGGSSVNGIFCVAACELEAAADVIVACDLGGRTKSRAETRRSGFFPFLRRFGELSMRDWGRTGMKTMGKGGSRAQANRNHNNETIRRLI